MKQVAKLLLQGQKVPYAPQYQNYAVNQLNYQQNNVFEVQNMQILKFNASLLPKHVNNQFFFDSYADFTKQCNNLRSYKNPDLLFNLRSAYYELFLAISSSPALTPYHSLIYTTILDLDLKIRFVLSSSIFVRQFHPFLSVQIQENVNNAFHLENLLKYSVNFPFFEDLFAIFQNKLLLNAESSVLNFEIDVQNQKITENQRETKNALTLLTRLLLLMIAFGFKTQKEKQVSLLKQLVGAEKRNKYDMHGEGRILKLLAPTLENKDGEQINGFAFWEN
ncbi:Hypothetical_protein [Hexamita inflata]|uniref:Hypothetical_protein n=1 Tax=Hexamita inflata TaxID=28002 RepID=A0AA86RFP7_9EUKA|nr:Hypothetical protein HINF_LOCUS64791 [Hexamita inflata]